MMPVAIPNPVPAIAVPFVPAGPFQNLLGQVFGNTNDEARNVDVPLTSLDKRMYGLDDSARIILDGINNRIPDVQDLEENVVTESSESLGMIGTVQKALSNFFSWRGSTATDVKDTPAQAHERVLLDDLENTEASIPKELVTMDQRRIDIPTYSIGRVVRYTKNVIQRGRNKLQRRSPNREEDGYDYVRDHADEIVSKSFDIAERYANGVQNMSDYQSAREAHNEVVRGIDGYSKINKYLLDLGTVEPLRPLPPKVIKYIEVKDVVLQRINDLESAAAVQPTLNPTGRPTENPTDNPTENPTARPTENPTDNPTENPTARPTENPTDNPTENPTARPTENPTDNPTENPTARPTENPTSSPTENPTAEPPANSTDVPTEPSATPTQAPTRVEPHVGNDIYQPAYSPVPANMDYDTRLEYIGDQLHTLRTYGKQLNDECQALYLANNPSCRDFDKFMIPFMWYGWAEERIQGQKEYIARRRAYPWNDSPKKIKQAQKEFFKEENKKYQDALKPGGMLRNTSSNNNMLDMLPARYIPYVSHGGNQQGKNLSEESGSNEEDVLISEEDDIVSSSNS